MKTYKPYMTASINRKGVLDIDTVKGCKFGMGEYPDGGCYGLCYAYKTARRYGYDFTESVSRNINNNNYNKIVNILKRHELPWFRIGVMGDPCYDWRLTLEACRLFSHFKIPIITTKHWRAIPRNMLEFFAKYNIVFNTSISPLDTYSEIKWRLKQFNRLEKYGIKSVLRIISCRFGKTKNGKRLNLIQQQLFENNPVIDNPLRIPNSDHRVVTGDILTDRYSDLGGGSTISMINPQTYIGKCGDCPDQCGYSFFNFED